MEFLMRHAICFVAVICFLIAPRRAGADPVGDNLFPPEMVMQHAQEIGLSDSQKQAIHDEMEKVQSRFPDMQQKLQAQMSALGDLLKADQPDEAKVLAQLDKVLDAERDVKKAHLSLVLAIRSKLTAEQQAKLRELRSKFAANQGPPPEIQAKMQKLSQAVQQSQKDGRDMSDLHSIMSEFQPLMQQGRFKEAESLLDKAMELLHTADKK
jgi:Spy/CpxP family protein refolding chaperone